MAQVCIIGAGSSGIAACQVLQARGIEFDCFEKGSGVGGNWRYGNDNGMSSAYRSLFINTSRAMMEYATYAMPDEYPDYPHHTQIARYFEDYVDHFGFRDRIAFRTEVTRVQPVGDRWEVTLDGGETRSYDAVIVANGHHWDPKYPEPPFPGQASFTGEQLHSHWYREADERFVDRRVLVLGIGNSATDIASETSRVSRMTYLATRRGAYVLPKFIGGVPLDQLAPSWANRLPFQLTRPLLMKQVNQVQGTMQSYGLPQPDHKLGQAHPTVSADLLDRIGHGRITPKPNIERIDGSTVHFVDGSSEQIDTIVWCTGYRITFPFLDDSVIGTAGNQVSLYRRVVHPDRPGLYFLGLVQPLGAIMPIAERQAEWIADLLEGDAALPAPERMRRAIEREDRKLRKRYVASTRHTIQVDFHTYMRALARERKR
ncbi:MAG TPA: NAD(P)-binding domain-containing protein, partial [Thermoleophilaceae bacterium]|nr:NAD(P)-binding domain-containing protein [Thermoleophilaceae bacterium]